MELPKPDWDRWANVDYATAQELILLSLDIEPNSVKDPKLLGEIESRRDYQDRCFAVQRGNGNAQGIMLNNLSRPLLSEYSMTKFVVWTQSLPKRWEVPNRFLGMTDDQALITEPPSYTTPLLDLMNSAISEFFNPRRSVDAKKEAVVEWIKGEGEKIGIEVSDHVARTIFTIIRPQGHNPKKRRV